MSRCCVIFIAGWILFATQWAALSFAQASPTVFYVTAHEDDWVLFRGEQAYKDIHDPHTKVVFIYTTAGDNGRADGWWEKREQAGKAAATVGLKGSGTDSIVTINNHRIHRFQFIQRTHAGIVGGIKIVTYFLRLPDGGILGYGYAGGHPCPTPSPVPSHDCPSLQNLRSHRITQLEAVDHSSVYRSWKDFRTTLERILATEAPDHDVSHPWVNSGDWCVECNPQDHPDHLATAVALKELFKQDNTYNRAWFMTYASMNCGKTLPPAAVSDKEKVWNAYRALAPTRTADQEWKAWGAKYAVRLANAGEADEPGAADACRL